jgi:hypothetical protein
MKYVKARYFPYEQKNRTITKQLAGKLKTVPPQDMVKP